MITLVLALACNSNEDLPDPPPDGGETSDSTCADTPLVTYEDWGRGFMTTYCQGCHASTTANRYGAPEGVTFDTEADVQEWADRIWVRVLEQDDMPPAGGVMDDDLVLLEWWLSCGL